MAFDMSARRCGKTAALLAWLADHPEVTMVTIGPDSALAEAVPLSSPVLDFEDGPL